MKEQAIEPDLLSLNDLNWGYRAARVLHTANKLGIFTILSEKEMSGEQICRTIKSDPEMMKKLLIACVAMGLLERHEGQYKNTDLAQKYLVRGQELYQGDIITHSATVWDFWSELVSHVVSGTKPTVIKPADHKNFIMGMHNIAVTGRAQLFIDSVDLTGRKKLFDVGGGPGTYSIAACRRYPELKAVVFDLPETIAITKEIISKEGIQDVITVREGDWETDDFGEDNDVVLLSDVMHGPGSKAQMKLKKAYDSLVCGGLVVIQEFLLNDQKTGPLIPALFNIMVGAYSQTEMFGIVEEAGFIKPRLVISSEELGSSWVTASK